MPKKSQPTVSVIIPVFNGAPYIRGSVEQVLNQTFKDVEIIIVDDGSTDETKKILGPWIAEKKITYIHQNNQGPSAARNTGIKEARGKFIKFLDCDDVLYPEQLEHQVRHLETRPELTILATNYEIEFPSKRKRFIDIYLKDNQLAQCIEGNPCPPVTILAYRSAVELVGGFDESLSAHEDSDIWLRIILKGGRFEKIPYLGCCYRVHGGSQSDNANKMFWNQCRYSEKINRALLPTLEQLPEETLRQLYYSNMEIMHRCFSQKVSLSHLPFSLKVNRRLYLKKTKLIRKWLVTLFGFKWIAYKEYRKFLLIDREYPKKIMTAFWRDENFYQGQKYPYYDLMARSKKVKNILFLNSSPAIYGAETRLLDILRNLDGYKFYPYVLLPHSGPLDGALRAAGVVTKHLEYGFPMDRLNRSTILRFLRINASLIRTVLRYDIDVIHANLHINMSKFWLAFLILRKPLVVHMRSHFGLKTFEKFVICRSFKTIFISRFVEREFLKKGKFPFLMQRKDNHSEILHDGIDINRFSPRPKKGKIRKEFKLKPKDFLVGMIGAVDQIKGQDLLLQAAKIVVKKHPHAKFIIVGDLYHKGNGNLAYKENLLQFIKKFKLTNNIIFTGFRYDTEIFMNEIDLLVQPSKREALGTSMVEAMGCGTPVIGTDIDGIPEVIGNNEAGLLLNPRTPEAFAKAINFFIENPRERKKLGSQARPRTLKLFNIFENIKHLERIYGEALQGQW